MFSSVLQTKTFTIVYFTIHRLPFHHARSFLHHVWLLTLFCFTDVIIFHSSVSHLLNPILFPVLYQPFLSLSCICTAPPFGSDTVVTPICKNRERSLNSEHMSDSRPPDDDVILQDSLALKLLKPVSTKSSWSLSLSLSSQMTQYTWRVRRSYRNMCWMTLEEFTTALRSRSELVRGTSGRYGDGKHMINKLSFGN